MANITPTLFSALQLPLQRNLKQFSIILAPCPFHLTSYKQQISTQRLFKVSGISPHPLFTTYIPHSTLKTRLQIVHQDIFSRKGGVGLKGGLFRKGGFFALTFKIFWNFYKKYKISIFFEFSKSFFFLNIKLVSHSHW